MTEIHIDIISDVMCPWCFIGKKRFEKALTELDPAIGVTIQWRPFQLDPTLPAEGKDRDTYLAEKFGGLDRAKTLYRNIEEAGAMEGIPFRFEAIKVSPNTLDAHRLIHWAQLEGRQTAVVSRLFKAYFVEGRDIGDRAVLADIAEGTGMERDMVERLFESGADADDIRARDIDAREKGVSAVPTFVIANQHVVPGAQPTDLWLKVIDEIAAQVEGSA